MRCAAIIRMATPRLSMLDRQHRSAVAFERFAVFLGGRKLGSAMKDILQTAGHQESQLWRLLAL